MSRREGVRYMQQSTRPGVRARSEGRTLTIVGFVLAGIAVFFFPIIFGPAGAICGGIAMSKGDPLGKWALIAGIAGMVLGMIIGVALISSMN